MFEHWETYCLRILWELGNSGILMFRNCENSYTRWLKIGKIYEYDVSRLWKFGDLEVGNFKHLTTWQLEISKFEFFIVVNFGSSKICLEIWRLEISNTWQLEISKFEIFTVGNFGSLKICLEIWKLEISNTWQLDNWKFRNLKFSLKFPQFENLFGDLKLGNFKHLTTWRDLIIENFEIWISAVRKFVWRFGGWKFQTLDNLTWLDNWKFRNLKFSLEFPVRKFVI